MSDRRETAGCAGASCRRPTSAASCSASGRGTFAAVASRSGERAEAFAREHGIARWHDSYEALLADPEIDAVYVPLPNALHVEWAIRALQAGKHVLCEKPMSRRPEEVAARLRRGRSARAACWPRRSCGATTPRSGARAS